MATDARPTTPVTRNFGVEEVEIDGRSFDRCAFKGSTLVYRGGDPPSFTGCSFDRTNFHFKDAAGNTMALLNAMYHGGMKIFVDAIVARIAGPLKADDERAT